MKIISHRGRSDLFPENTVESILEGLLTSDYSEFDVLLTKDHQLIVFHDRMLSAITNVGKLEYFADKKTVHDDNEFGQEMTEDWWVKDLTLQELQKLDVIQKHPKRPQITDRTFHIPTLDEVLRKAKELKRQHPNVKSGLLMEIKTQRESQRTFTERDYIILKKIAECLQANDMSTSEQCNSHNLPLIVEAFNKSALYEWFNKHNAKLPLIHLHYDEDLEMLPEELQKLRTTNSLGLAVGIKRITRQFVRMCHEMKYEVYTWTVVDDREGEIPLMCKSYPEVYIELQNLGVDAVITDFAGNCAKALNREGTF